MHMQDLECSVLVCQSQLALVINDQAFCLLGHLMTIGKILACMPVEWGVELVRNILVEIRSRSLSAFGPWVKCNLLVWIYSGSFLVSVDWQQEFMVPLPWSKLLSVKSSKYDWHNGYGEKWCKDTIDQEVCFLVRSNMVHLQSCQVEFILKNVC